MGPNWRTHAEHLWQSLWLNRGWSLFQGGPTKHQQASLMEPAAAKRFGPRFLWPHVADASRRKVGFRSGAVRVVGRRGVGFAHVALTLSSLSRHLYT